MWRTASAPRAHLLDRALVTFEERLDRSIAAVGHPAGHAPRLSLTSAGVAEEHPLHAAVDDDSAGHDWHVVNLSSVPLDGPGHDGLVTDAPVRFDTKIALVVRDDLLSWQRLNVTAFLSGAIAAADPTIIGEPYADADETPYLAMFGQPVLVFEATKDVLTAAHGRALARDLPMAVFTADLFATGNDRDNRAAVRAVPRDKLDLVGLAMHGPRNAVDKIVKGSRMHP